MTAKTRPESTDKAAPAKKETSPTTVMLRASGLFVLVLLLLFGVLFIKQALHDRSETTRLTSQPPTASTY